MINHLYSKPSIYIVDDDPDDQEMLLNAFQQITDDHHLKALKSEKDLLELLAHADDGVLPCLIVLDCNMPEMDGKQTLTFLQNNKRYQRIPKVIYSTSALTSDRLTLISMGAKDYMVKPNSLSEIVGAARRMLNYCSHSVVTPA